MTKTLRDVAQSVVDWNTKYPSSRIYSEGEIRRIAAEMDVIFADAKEALRATVPPSDVQRDADRWRFLCSLPTDDWLKLAVVADNEIDAAIDQLKLKREPTGCLMRADYRAPVTKEESR